MASFVFLLLLVAAAVHVAGQQPGFLSIDCGLDDKSSGYTDPHRGIFYVSDGVYVDEGENVKVAAEYEKRQWVRSYLTARSFPSGERNCYALPTVAGAKYMVRLVFVYGNHDGKNDSSSLEFDLHLGPHYWDTVRFGFIVVVYEGVFLAWASWAPVCLVNTGRGTPFLSVLELRPLGDAFYPPVGANQSLSMYRRLDIGASVQARYGENSC